MANVAVSAIVFVSLLLAGTPRPCRAEEKHPPETRQVIAVGEAPADDPEAQDHAKAAALRNAVMQGVGVFVESTTRAENYRVIQNDILAKAAGFAVLDEVQSSVVKDGILKVTIKATVSSVPLAQKLKDMGLLHDWRVAVYLPETYTRSQPQRIPDPAAETAVMQKIKQAGFRLIDESRRKELRDDDMAVRAAKGDVAAIKAIMREYDVDVFVTGEAFAEYIDQAQEGGVTLYRTRGRIETRAYYMDTAELLSITEAFANGVDQSEVLSSKQCFKSAGQDVGEILAKDLLLAPAPQTQLVTVKITRFPSLTAASSLGQALKKLPGVTRVSEHRYTSGTQEWDVYVKTEYRGSLAGNIESCPAAKTLGIRIDSSSKTSVTGRATKR